MQKEYYKSNKRTRIILKKLYFKKFWKVGQIPMEVRYRPLNEKIVWLIINWSDIWQRKVLDHIINFSWNEYMHIKNTKCLKWFVQFYYNFFQKNKGVSLCRIFFFTFLHLKLNLNYFVSKNNSLSIWAFWSKTFLCPDIFIIRVDIFLAINFDLREHEFWIKSVNRTFFLNEMGLKKRKIRQMTKTESKKDIKCFQFYRFYKFLDKST